MNGSHDRSTLVPVNDTGPNPVAAVCWNEIADPASVSRSSRPGFRSSPAARAHARRCCFSRATAVYRYHQAMSCGLTNDTVVHHGRFAGAFAYQDWN